MGLRFFYLYLAGGIIAVGLLVYNFFAGNSQIYNASTPIEILSAAFFFYMANKTYREMKDKDLM